MSFFLPAFDLVLGEEGGFVDDASDPGGATKYGISQAAYPDLDISRLTLQDAQDIYRSDYWDKCGCDSLPWSKAVLIFDAAVNQGPNYAVTLLQSTDVEIAVSRAQRYMQAPTFRQFGKGWLTRLFTVFKAAQTTPA